MGGAARQKFEHAIPLYLATLLLGGCSDILPPDFQDQALAISVVDDEACDLLKRPLIIPDTMFTEPGIVDTIILDTLYLEVTARYDSLAAVFDSLTADSVTASPAAIAAAFDSVLEGLAALATDTTLLIQSVGSRATGGLVAYAHSASAAGGPMVFYLNEPLRVELIMRDGTAAAIESEAISYETVAGCTEVEKVEIVPGVFDVKGYIRVMKARFEFELETGVYLVRLTRGEGAAGGAFRAAILQSL